MFLERTNIIFKLSANYLKTQLLKTIKTCDSSQMKVKKKLSRVLSLGFYVNLIREGQGCVAPGIQAPPRWAVANCSQPTCLIESNEKEKA